MTKDERKLLDLLIPFGDPRNILIVDFILTFDLRDPNFGESIEGVIKLQDIVREEFPEYFYIHKMVNDKNSFWIVLMKKRS